MSQEVGQYEDSNLNQIRFEYAWRYFEMHAKQRITMFNFFLLGSGVLANAYGLLLREELHLQAGAVAAVGFLVCVISFMLDVRNHQLVRLGENALRRVEGDIMLPAGQDISDSKPPEYMILTRERNLGETFLLLKHKTLIRSLEGAAAFAFLLAALASYSNGASVDVIGSNCSRLLL